MASIAICSKSTRPDLAARCKIVCPPTPRGIRRFAKECSTTEPCRRPTPTQSIKAGTDSAPALIRMRPTLTTFASTSYVSRLLPAEDETEEEEEDEEEDEEEEDDDEEEESLLESLLRASIICVPRCAKCLPARISAAVKALDPRGMAAISKSISLRSDANIAISVIPMVGYGHIVPWTPSIGHAPSIGITPIGPAAPTRVSWLCSTPVPCSSTAASESASSART